MTDLITIIWKEWKEIFLLRGSVRSSLINLAIIIGLIGVFFPLQSGADWLNSPAGLAVWAWFPLFTVMGIVADGFAGERERHTLETLLASRLPDRAILFGKIAAAVLYGWSIVVVSVLLGAVTVNISSPTGYIQFYPLPIFVLGLLFSLLGTILMSAAGVLVSLHSATTRQAYQKLSISFMVLWFIPVLLLQFLPTRVIAPLLSGLQRLDLAQVVTFIIIGLILLDGVLLAIASRQFQRSRLILD